MKAVKDMTDKALRIRVAELCGWVSNWMSTRNGWTDDLVRSMKMLEDMPDYPKDLNAMHEAEKATGQGYFGYAIILASIVQGRKPSEVKMTSGSMFDCAHATARQRAEAFVELMRIK